MSNQNAFKSPMSSEQDLVDGLFMIDLNQRLSSIQNMAESLYVSYLTDNGSTSSAD